MPRPMLYGSHLRGYVPYTRGLRSGRTEWIILRIAHKKKLANSFILFGAMNKFSCLRLPIIHAYNVGIFRLQSYARLRSEHTTPIVCPTLVICLTPVGRHDFGCISWLQTHFPIPVDIMTPVAHHGSGRWACRMSYHLSCERLRMAGLDDYSILQPGHLVGSRLGGTHDSFSVQNLNIARLRKFKCQAMLRDQ
jgi:hypothetical protein